MLIEDRTNIYPKGHVKIFFLNKKNGKVIKYEDHNLVVREGRKKIVDIILEKATISKMAIKKDSAITENSIPQQPQATDTFASVFGNSCVLSPIINKVGIYEDDNGYELINPKIEFTAIFDCDDIDSFVNQIGLIAESESVNYLFALFSLNKSYDLRADQDMIIQIIWRIEF